MTVENRKSAFIRPSSGSSGFDHGNGADVGATDGGGSAFLPASAGDLTFSQDAHMAHELVCLFLAIDDPEARERCLDFVRQQAAANDR